MHAWTGKAVLDYLTKLSDEELSKPLIAKIKVIDANESDDLENYALYPCIGCSVLPHGIPAFHVARCSRATNKGHQPRRRSKTNT